MKTAEFTELKQTVKQLSPNQKKQLQDMLAKPEDISLIIKLMDAKLTKWPHCGADELQKWRISGNRQRYRCTSCKKTCNGLTGMHYQDKWNTYVETMLHGTFLRQAAAECGIALSTSFNWRHKCLKLADNLTDRRLEGIVAIDETEFNWSEKGNRNLVRDARKRGADKTDEKVKVVVAKDRSGHIFDKVMPTFTLSKLKPALLPPLASDIVLCSDGHMNYYWLTRKENIKHVELNASANEWVKDKVFHIQNVNNYYGKLKGWIYGFRGVASKALHKYVGWMRWFEQNKRSKQTIEQFLCDMLIKDSVSTNFAN